MVLLLRVLDMLILDLGVADTYYFEAVDGLGIPPPEILTEAVFILFLVLLGGGLIVELLLDYEIVLTIDVNYVF